MTVIFQRPQMNRVNKERQPKRGEDISGPSRFPKWFRPSTVEWLIAAIDAGLILASGMGCAVIYHLLWQTTVYKPGVYLSGSILVAINFVLLIAVQRGYVLKNVVNLRRQLRTTLATWTAVFAALIAIAFTMKVSDEFSRATTISFYLVGIGLLSLARAAVSRWTASALRSEAFSNSQVVIIAERGLSASSAALVELRQHGYRIVHTLEIRTKDINTPLLMSHIKPDFEALVQFTREHQIERILLLMDWSRQHAIESILDALKIVPIPVYLVPDASVSRYLRYPLASTGDTWTAELRRPPLSWNERGIKRAIDVAGGLFALMVFSPVILIAGVFVFCSSRGPVLFLQTRNGFNGRAFKIYKFRTMRVLEDGPRIVQATRNDPRVTVIGKWLRKTSIDELPQIFNVLRGDMSLVGPRPHAAAHNAEYQQLIGQYAFRHHVKPGITGWAQVNGYRGETITLDLMEKRVEYDLWYINNWSVWLDFIILLRTALATFVRPNAY